MNEALHTEINKKYTNFKDDYLQVSKHIKFVKSKQSLRYAINNLDSAFKLIFNFGEPLSFFFHKRCNEGYDTIFKNNLKFIIYQNVTSKLYSLLKNERNSDFEFNKICKIFFQVYHILNSFQTFYFYEIIEKSHRDLINNLKTSVDVYYMIHSHSDFLNSLINVLNNPIIKFVNKLYVNFSKLYVKV